MTHPLLPRRWLARTLAAAALTALVAACGAQTERIGTAAGDDRPASDVSSRLRSERYKVDAPNGIEAYITGEQLDAQSKRIDARLLIEGTGVDGVRSRYLDPPDDVGVAYQVLEAIELHDASGKLVGYWGAYFVSIEEYQAELARAQILTAEYEATNPRE